MLVDTVKWALDPYEVFEGTGLIYTNPKRLSLGVYDDLNLGWHLPNEEWERLPRQLLHDHNVYPYGVVDDPKQFHEIVGVKLAVLPNDYVVGLTCIRREDQPPKNGWRWHKWGPYLGDRQTAAALYEYLYDSKTIDEVWCYQVMMRLTPH